MGLLESLIYYVVIKLLSVTLVDTQSYWVDLFNDDPIDIPIDRRVLINE